MDVELSYDLNESSAIMLGGNNIFDEAGSKKHNGAASAGNTYSEFAPMGFSGASGMPSTATISKVLLRVNKKIGNIESIISQRK